MAFNSSRNIAALVGLLTLASVGSTLRAGDWLTQLKDAGREAAGLLSLNGDYAEAKLYDRREGGGKKVSLHYVHAKQHFYKSINVEPGSSFDAPNASEGQEVYKSGTYVFVTEGANVRAVYDHSGNSVSFHELFQWEMESSDFQLASGKKVSFKVDPDATAHLDGRSKSGGSSSGDYQQSYDDDVVRKSEDVLIWYRGDLDELTDEDQLQEFDVSTYGGFDGDPVVGSDGYVREYRNVRVRTEFLEENKKHLHRVHIANYGSTGAQSLYGIEFDDRKVGPMTRRRLGNYTVYGGYGSSFQAVSVHSLTPEQLEAAQTMGDWAMDKIGDLFGSN